jgi:serine/threonine-protein kinase RsbW
MKHAHGKLSFELTNDLAEMSLVADHLEQFCTRQGIGFDVVSQVNLALDEIVTHIIAHGYGDTGLDRRIRINLAHDGHALTARIEDDAAAFDPMDINLVNTLVDEITYTREHDQNVLVIRKII